MITPSPPDLEQVFGISQAEKEPALLRDLLNLTEHHSRSCHKYERLLRSIGWTGDAALTSQLPWLPVRLFKDHELRSIPSDDVFRRLTSSGTTGANVSKIDLDADSAQLQAKALTRTLQVVLGPQRLPMLILDSKKVTRGASFSARGAGVLGMMNFGRKHVFALDDEMQLDRRAVQDFLEKHAGEPFLIFGFTFLVWHHLSEIERSDSLDLSNGILVHSGGWKKLINLAVPPEEFRQRLQASTGLKRIHNYYGMVEQIGTLFLESPEGDGSLVCPSFADVVIRDPLTFDPVPDGEPGLIQTLSLLPRSYPGHSVLTEDLGTIVGVNDTEWKGRRFVVHGRLPRAEARGCSDTAEV